MENINKLEIVPDEVYEIGADKAPVIPEWSVKDDTTLYEKVNKLAHSTFDRSKFTAVGSLIITDDGIASGFSGSNYLTVTTFNPSAKIWKIKGSFTTGTTLPNQSQKIFGSTLIYDGVNFGIYGNTIQLSISNNGTSMNIADETSTLTISTNTTYYYEIIFDGANYKVNLSTNSKEWTNYISKASNLTINSFTIQIGAFRNGIAPFNSSIDLKQFSITVDGVEVFSGNKTGIDTIKSDDYTVVGSPTISEDGVASGLGINSYLKIPNIDFSKSWEINCTYTTSASISSQALIQFYEGLTSANDIYIVMTSSGVLSFRGLENSLNTTASLQANTTYNISVGWDTTKYFIKINDTVEYLNSTIPIASTDDIKIGVERNLWYWQGYIDLNAFKIYVDGDLVYQPCLKIPYTEGQNYVKVVDKLYRDRVKDLFEQEGYNIYYTLGENDFTLPSHKPNDIVKYKADGLTVAEQRADQTLTIRGACESGTDVNLPMNFFDGSSYAVFGVGTTGTNTASKFTPAADGNYIAIGKGKV